MDIQLHTSSTASACCEPGSTCGSSRAELLRRGRRLEWFTLGRNVLEGAAAIGAGLLAGSVALVGFGAKRKLAGELDSRALQADSRQTDICVYLSFITLGGLALNALLGWWWADGVAALCLVPIITKEGWDGVRGQSCGYAGGCH